VVRQFIFSRFSPIKIRKEIAFSFLKKLIQRIRRIKQKNLFGGVPFNCSRQAEVLLPAVVSSLRSVHPAIDFFGSFLHHLAKRDKD
jgi:hypothetical protein